MKKNENFKGKIAVIALIISIVFSVHTVSAQNAVDPMGITAIPPVCVSFAQNLYVGIRDTASSGQIRMLQDFLNARGYMHYPGTGFFGSLTFSAVKQFQVANGIPSTGFVGPLTRAKIRTLSTCAIVDPDPGAIQINQLSPTAGPIGTIVTLTGNGFTSTSTIKFGAGAISNITYSSSNSISFTVPDYMGQYCAPGMMCTMIAQQVTPGTYPVTVMNLNQASNTVNFTITSNTSGSFSISGLDAPTSLTINNSGTWMVHVTSPSTVGNLHYSVAWGDESTNTTQSITAPQTTTVQNSATFTHSYSRTGTFAPQFTVRDDNGHSATTSTTVTITPIY